MAKIDKSARVNIVSNGDIFVATDATTGKSVTFHPLSYFDDDYVDEAPTLHQLIHDYSYCCFHGEPSLDDIPDEPVIGFINDAIDGDDDEDRHRFDVVTSSGQIASITLRWERQDSRTRQGSTLSQVYLDMSTVADYKGFSDFGFGLLNTTPTETIGILVAGSRDCTDYPMFCDQMDKLTAGMDLQNVTVISGGARGADTLAERWCRDKHVQNIVMPADWKPNGVYDPHAGYVRNDKMHERLREFDNRTCICFWNGESRGTKQNFATSERLGENLIIFDYEKDTFVDKNDVPVPAPYKTEPENVPSIQSDVIKPGKVKIMRLQNIPEAERDHAYAICRSVSKGMLQNPMFSWIGNDRNISALSPSWDLMKWYRNEVDNKTWSDDKFQSEYLPRFVREMAYSMQAENAFAEIYDRTQFKGEDIILGCFCEQESMCHRSIVAGILQGVGIEVETEHGTDYRKYYAMYYQEKQNAANDGITYQAEAEMPVPGTKF